MGNRVVMQCVDASGNFGPVVYGHWSGEDTPEIIRRFTRRMQGRDNDIEYATARLVQEMCNGADGNTGFGCWNADHILNEADSHGDAGVVLIDVSNGFSPTYFGGYLAARAA